MRLPGAMGRAGLVVLVWLVVAEPGSAGDPAAGSEDAGRAWPAFRSEAARFSVLLPAPPKETRSSRMTLGGRIDSSVYRVQTGATELRIERHEVPSIARVFLSDESLLDRARRDFLADERASDVRVSPSELQGHPGQSVSYRVLDDQALGRALFILAGSHLYVLATLQPVTVPPDTLDPFFRSFHLDP